MVLNEKINVNNSAAFDQYVSQPCVVRNYVCSISTFHSRMYNIFCILKLDDTHHFVVEFKFQTLYEVFFFFSCFDVSNFVMEYIPLDGKKIYFLTAVECSRLFTYEFIVWNVKCHLLIYLSSGQWLCLLVDVFTDCSSNVKWREKKKPCSFQ